MATKIFIDNELKAIGSGQMQKKLKTANAVVQSNNSILLLNDGAAWASGSNSYFWSTNADKTISTSSPVSVVGRKFSKVCHTAYTGCGLDSSGSIYTWGGNYRGSLLDLRQSNYSSPVLAVALSGLTQINGQVSIAAGLKSDGSAWTWGDSNGTYGGLGNNTMQLAVSPVRVVGNHSFINIVSSSNNCYGLKADGTVWSWGFNRDGQLGDGTYGWFGKSSPVSVVGNHSFIALSMKSYMCAALKADGSMWGWGGNPYGQIGDQTIMSKSSPVAAVGAHSFIAISVGSNLCVALKADGSAWACGQNIYGGLGDNTLTNKSSPVSVVGNHSFIRISARDAFVFALKADGTCWSWGLNNYGQLGDGTMASKSSPVSVVGNHSFIKISAGYSHVSALKADGSLWSWGINEYGQLGDGTMASKSSPVSVVGNHSFTDISALDYGTFAFKADGSTWSFGRNYLATLGLGYAPDWRLSPEAVYSGAKNLNFLEDSFIGLTTDGRAFGWGYNAYYQLGSGDNANKTSPVFSIGGLSFSTLGSGSGHVIAISTDNKVYGWGNNTTFQITPTTLSYSSPVAIPAASNYNILSTSGSHMLALKYSDGSVWAWGNNSYGQLGNQSTSDKSDPSAVVGNHSFIYISAEGLNGNTAALKADGSAWCWGSNSYGQLGDFTAGTLASKSSPVSVVGNHSFIKIFACAENTIAFKADGTAWAWGGQGGYSTYYMNGDGTTTSKSSPVAVVGNHSFIEVISKFYHTLARKADGSTWGWGHNYGGGIGDFTGNPRTSPVQVVGNHSFVKIAVGATTIPTYYYTYSMGLKSDGTLWMWGVNNFGQLGDNTRTNKSSPISVVGAHSFVEISAGFGHSAALKADGSMWTWGSNTYGQLGDNTLASKSSPISVVGGHSFISLLTGLTNTFGVKADGTVWGFGQANYVFGTNSNVLAPQLIINTNSYSKIECNNITTYGLHTDSTLWAWGSNAYGQIGDNTRNNASIPTSVVGAHSFSVIARSDRGAVHYAALKTDGSAWAWGLNTFGQIGDNSTVSRSSPVSVVGGHSFIGIYIGTNHTFAVKNDGTIWAWGLSSYGELATQARTSYSSPVLVTPMSTIAGGRFVPYFNTEVI